MAKRKNEAYWNASMHRWQIHVQADGVRKTFISSKANSRENSKKGKIEAERKADAWLESHTVNGATRCSVLLDQFVEDVKARTGTSNYVQVEKFVRIHIKPVIGNVKIEDLSEGHLQGVLNKARGHGRANTGEHLAEKTLKGIRATLTSFVKYCRKHRYTTLHIEELTIPSGAKRSERTILQPEALTVLMNDDATQWRGKICREPYIYAYRFAAVTGLRPGEVIGLRRINIKNGIYSVRRSINDYGETTDGKNENAMRSGALGDVAKAIIKDQEAALRERGIVSPFVFPDVDGGPMTQKKYYTHWKRYCEHHGITEGTKPYELRHTYCSVNDEMPDGLKKMTMGHSKSMDTDGVYGHRKRGDMERAAAFSDEAMAPYLKTGTK